MIPAHKTRQAGPVPPWQGSRGWPGAGQAPAPGTGHLAGDRGGLRPGRHVSLWVAAAQQGPWPGPRLRGSGSCSSGRAQARDSADSGPPGLGVSPGHGHLTASASLSQAHSAERATLGGTGSELAPSPGSQKPCHP